MKPADSWCSFSDDGDYSSGKCTAGACVERTKCADVNMPACWKLATSAPTYGDGSKEMCGVHSQGDCMSQGDSAGGSCLAGTCKAKPLCSAFVQPTCMVASSKKYGDTEADCSVSATVGADCKVDVMLNGQVTQTVVDGSCKYTPTATATAGGGGGGTAMAPPYCEAVRLQLCHATLCPVLYHAISDSLPPSSSRLSFTALMLQMSNAGSQNTPKSSTARRRGSASR